MRMYAGPADQSHNFCNIFKKSRVHNKQKGSIIVLI
nr:MAG TPA: hypothetical protein [Caudoviricetes sp.]